MRPMGCARYSRSAERAACSSVAARSMAPRSNPARSDASELTPKIVPRKPACFSASPKDPPIRPTPTMATVSIAPALNGPAHRGRNQAQLLHQFYELLRTQRLRAIAEGAVGIGMHFDQQTVGAGSHRGARHRRYLVAASGAVRGVGHHGQVRKLLYHWDG